MWAYVSTILLRIRPHVNRAPLAPAFTAPLRKEFPRWKEQESCCGNDRRNS
jgi:hypothetical protein